MVCNQLLSHTSAGLPGVVDGFTGLVITGGSSSRIELDDTAPPDNFLSLVAEACLSVGAALGLLAPPTATPPTIGDLS